MNQRVPGRFVFISILILSAVSFAQQPAPAPDTPKDTITRIFTGEFREPISPPPRWFDGGQSYIAMEPVAGGHGRDVVKYDTAMGKKREVLITAAQLTPEGAKEPPWRRRAQAQGFIPTGCSSPARNFEVALR